MSNSNLELALKLRIAQTGLENIQPLISELQSAGVETSKFSLEAESLSAELQHLGREQEALADRGQALTASLRSVTKATETPHGRGEDLGTAADIASNWAEDPKRLTAGCGRYLPFLQDVVENPFEYQDRPFFMGKVISFGTIHCQHAVRLPPQLAECWLKLCGTRG